MLAWITSLHAIEIQASHIHVSLRVQGGVPGVRGGGRSHQTADGVRYHLRGAHGQPYGAGGPGRGAEDPDVCGLAWREFPTTTTSWWCDDTPDVKVQMSLYRRLSGDSRASRRARGGCASSPTRAGELAGDRDRPRALHVHPRRVHEKVPLCDRDGAWLDEILTGTTLHRRGEVRDGGEHAARGSGGTGPRRACSRGPTSAPWRKRVSMGERAL